MSDSEQAAQVDYSRENLQALPQRQRTNLVNSLSGYKGVNLLGSANAQGAANLAIISSVIHVGANPPLMGLLFRPHTVPRHSLENILSTGHFTLNAVDDSFYRAAHQSSARYPEEISEFAATGLQEAWEADHRAPFVACSPLRMALEYREHHTLTCNETVFLVGEIQTIQIARGAVEDDGLVDLEALRLVCLSGLDCYHTAKRLSREPYAKP